MHGTHTGELLGVPATNREVVIYVIDVVRLRRRKYIEHWGITNLPSVLRRFAEAHERGHGGIPGEAHPRAHLLSHGDQSGRRWRRRRISAAPRTRDCRVPRGIRCLPLQCKLRLSKRSLIPPLVPTAITRLQHVAHAAMQERGLLPDSRLPSSPRPMHSRTRPRPRPRTATWRDLRSLLWASIDNDDSRDLDQLSVAGEAAGGAETILVAVADVDALVRKGSNIDNHAAVNTTSVYTAAEIFPMLPEKLSTDLTSLNPDEDRLAVVVEMTVAADGSLTKSAVYRAVVRNHAKLAYNSVAAWLEGKAAAPAPLAAVPGLPEQLRRQSRVAQQLKRMRESRGALQLDTLETPPHLLRQHAG